MLIHSKHIVNAQAVILQFTFDPFYEHIPANCEYICKMAIFIQMLFRIRMTSFRNSGIDLIPEFNMGKFPNILSKIIRKGFPNLPPPLQPPTNSKTQINNEEWDRTWYSL